MYKLLLFIPFLSFLGLMAFLRYREKKDKERYDLPFRDDHERPPGESLRLKLDDLYTDLMSELLVITACGAMPVMLLAAPTNRIIIVTVVVAALVGLWISARKLLKMVPQIRRYKIGFNGERITGQYIQELIADGYRVFHDIPMKDYNVDHVVVGPNGVFAIETKTRRKLWSAGKGRAEVIYDGKSLQYPEQPPENYGLDAAVSRSRGLQEWLTSAVGETIMVRPILALPGWFVVESGNNSLPVKNPKNIRGYIKRQTSVSLSPEQIQRIAHQIFEKSKFEAGTKPGS